MSTLSPEEEHALVRQPRVRTAQVVQVLKVVAIEGALDWQGPEDVVREVTYFYDMDGGLLVRHDPADGRPT